MSSEDLCWWRVGLKLTQTLSSSGRSRLWAFLDFRIHVLSHSISFSFLQQSSYYRTQKKIITPITRIATATPMPINMSFILLLSPFCCCFTWLVFFSNVLPWGKNTHTKGMLHCVIVYLTRFDTSRSFGQCRTVLAQSSLLRKPLHSWQTAQMFHWILSWATLLIVLTSFPRQPQELLDSISESSREHKCDS